MKKDLKEQILQSAVRSFLAIGYEKTTLRAIAKSLGVALGNVSYYYPKKEDLVRGYHDMVMEAFLPKGGENASSEDPWMEYFLTEYRFLHFIAFDKKTAGLFVAFTNVPALRQLYIDTHQALFLSFFPDPPFTEEEAMVSTIAMCALQFGMIQSLISRDGFDLPGTMRHIFQTRLAFLGMDPKAYAASIDRAVSLGENSPVPVIYGPELLPEEPETSRA